VSHRASSMNWQHQPAFPPLSMPELNPAGHIRPSTPSTGVQTAGEPLYMAILPAHARMPVPPCSTIWSSSDKVWSLRAHRHRTQPILYWVSNVYSVCGLKDCLSTCGPTVYMGPLLHNGCICTLQAHIPMFLYSIPLGECYISTDMC
jgi:hypothetical protein